MSTGAIVGDSIYEVGGDYCCPPIAREGLAAAFAFQAPRGDLTAELEHRNSENTTWSHLANFAGPITSVGNNWIDATEIVRFKFTPGTDSRCHIYIQEPSWRPHP